VATNLRAKKRGGGGPQAECVGTLQEGKSQGEKNDGGPINLVVQSIAGDVGWLGQGEKSTVVLDSNPLPSQRIIRHAHGPEVMNAESCVNR